MRDVIFLLLHLITTLAKLVQPGGSHAVVAENLILKQQLIIHSRSRQRAPNLSTQTPILHITHVEYVRFVGYNWSFYPGGTPILFSKSATVSPPETRGDSL
jgi:hypothetical protein